MNAGTLVVRLTIGLCLAPHGAQKLFGWFRGGGLAPTSAAFANRFRFPRFSALLAGLCEFVGGLALAAGLLTPLAAAVVIGVMTSAAVSFHLSKGFFLNRGGYEYNLVLAGSAAGIALIGPGEYSIDDLLGLHWESTAWGVAAIAVGLAAAALQLVIFTRRQPTPAPEVTPEGARPVDAT